MIAFALPSRPLLALPSELLRAGYPWMVSGLSAWCAYLRLPQPSLLELTAVADLGLLSKFHDLHNQGDEWGDASATIGGTQVRFRLVARLDQPARRCANILDLRYDPLAELLHDPYAVRKDARLQRIMLDPGTFDTGRPVPWMALGELAVLTSWCGALPPQLERCHFDGPPLLAASQRTLLSQILLAPEPWSGLALLERFGFLQPHWPVLAELCQTDQFKDYHPEGNVWEHTLATLRYRRRPDLALSLGLLFHDVGKPHAEKTRTHAFHGHAEIGATLSVKVLRAMGFEELMLDEVHFLVRHHMLPPSLPDLSMERIEHVLRSPYFIKLLALSRCDQSSTYGSLERYHRAMEHYRKFARKAGLPVPGTTHEHQ